MAGGFLVVLLGLDGTSLEIFLPTPLFEVVNRTSGKVRMLSLVLKIYISL